MGTSETFESELANRINAALHLSRMSKNKLANESAIPYATLHRKLQRPTLLTVLELSSIASALDVTVGQLLPSAEQDAA